MCHNFKQNGNQVGQKDHDVKYWARLKDIDMTITFNMCATHTIQNQRQRAPAWHHHATRANVTLGHPSSKHMSHMGPQPNAACPNLASTNKQMPVPSHVHSSANNRMPQVSCAMNKHQVDKEVAPHAPRSNKTKVKLRSRSIILNSA